MTGVSGAETERSGPKVGWSAAERERGAAERERSGERKSDKSGLMRSGKTFRSAHMLWSGSALLRHAGWRAATTPPQPGESLSTRSR